jgi:hypothetical protein
LPVNPAEHPEKILPGKSQRSPRFRRRTQFSDRPRSVVQVSRFGRGAWQCLGQGSFWLTTARYLAVSGEWQRSLQQFGFAVD